MSSQPGPGGEHPFPRSAQAFPSEFVLVVIDEVSEAMANGAQDLLGGAAARFLSRIAAQGRSGGTSTGRLLARASVPQVPALDDAIAVRQYLWPAGCHVERSPAGRWTAWFAPGGCRYSAGDLGTVHGLAVKAAPAAGTPLPGVPAHAGTTAHPDPACAAKAAPVKGNEDHE